MKNSDEFAKYLEAVNKNSMPACGGYLRTPYGEAQYAVGARIKDSNNNASQKSFVRIMDEGALARKTSELNGDLMLEVEGQDQARALGSCLIEAGHALLMLSDRQNPNFDRTDGFFNA